MPFDEPMLNDVPLPLPSPSSNPTELPPGDSPLSAIESGDESDEEEDTPFDVLYGNARTGLEEGGMRSMECNDSGGAAAKKSKKAERTGATHLIHGGAMQGRKTAMYHSADFGDTVTRRQVATWYFLATDPIAVRIAAYFEVFWPRFYAKYRQAFDAGVWVREDRGPFLGRVLVYKLQVSLRQDRGDFGLTVTFNAGCFEGGEYYFPDLHAKLRYAPGDIVIALSGILYHSVAEWRPVPVPDSWVRRNLTPGRISHVFFFPKKSSGLFELQAANVPTPSGSELLREDRMYIFCCYAL
ncbi:uncharacterized protein STEHIDRAFT_126381 [Stereum hirsutum FP-91666 SS1]|uniref:Uncharacterized protein n=1 Tax=Stereum hirsutum (strain FP-91666) TaxID=721885 RepID=R7RZF4_STEHR|nr:uncharacterized protein STEHIDRAFT_126381 [Stereum hirsutum FP-91666 SS1]EIM79692.1 hypothetical protein STEHIDRAFT_126381 [Stereum hirsutum FP-91666 SS1]